MYLACIWEPPVKPRPYRTFAVITAGATGLLGELHDRAPGLIAHDDVPTWLGEKEIEPLDALRLVRQLSPDSVEAWPVSRKVSLVTNEGAELADPI